MIVNGTHEAVESSTGITNGILHHLKVFVINGTNGTSYIVGNSNHSGDIHSFRSIGHMGADGTMKFIGSSITSKGVVGIDKGVIYKNGTGIVKEWRWK